MANTLTDMSKIRKVIKLYSKGNSKLFISTYLSLSRNTVKKYISLFEASGKTKEEILANSDSELALFFSGGKEEAVSPKLQELYDYIKKMERELKKVGVTIHHLWEAYIALNSDGFKSSQFRHHYRIWSNKVNPVMHMHHKCGDKMYVDYAGKTLSIIEKASGELREVQFFVAILGGSQYTYAEATMSQQKEDFVYSVERAIRYFGGVPPVIVPEPLN